MKNARRERTVYCHSTLSLEVHISGQCTRASQDLSTCSIHEVHSHLQGIAPPGAYRLFCCRRSFMPSLCRPKAYFPLSVLHVCSLKPTTSALPEATSRTTRRQSSDQHDVAMHNMRGRRGCANTLTLLAVTRTCLIRLIPDSTATLSMSLSTAVGHRRKAGDVGGIPG